MSNYAIQPLSLMQEINVNIVCFHICRGIPIQAVMWECIMDDGAMASRISAKLKLDNISFSNYYIDL